MPNKIKATWLWRAAEICWFVENMLALPANLVGALGDWFKKRSLARQFGDRF